jgi:hypothetical protein
VQHNVSSQNTPKYRSIIPACPTKYKENPLIERITTTKPEKFIHPAFACTDKIRAACPIASSSCPLLSDENDDLSGKDRCFTESGEKKTTKKGPKERIL